MKYEKALAEALGKARKANKPCWVYMVRGGAYRTNTNDKFASFDYVGPAWAYQHTLALVFPDGRVFTRNERDEQ